MAEQRDMVTVAVDDLQALRALVHEAHRIVHAASASPLEHYIGGTEPLSPGWAMRPAQGLLLAAMKRVTAMLEGAAESMKQRRLD
jgi:hypothetical protein